MFTSGSPVGQRECTDIGLINDEAVETSPESFNVQVQSDDPVTFVETTGFLQ